MRIYPETRCFQVSALKILRRRATWEKLDDVMRPERGRPTRIWTTNVDDPMGETEQTLLTGDGTTPVRPHREFEARDNLHIGQKRSIVVQRRHHHTETLSTGRSATRRRHLVDVRPRPSRGTESGEGTRLEVASRLT